jgi:hypothetical protein
MNHPNYPPSTSAWYAQNYYNAGCEEVENLCSECGKPCDEPTCKLCLEGIAEMIAIMDSNLTDLADFSGLCVFFLALAAAVWL